MSTVMRVSIKKEMGRWTIRIDGKYVDDYWSKARAYEVAFRLTKILEAK